MKNLLDLQADLRLAGYKINSISQSAPQAADITTWDDNYSPSPEEIASANAYIASYDWEALTPTQQARRDVLMLAPQLEQYDYDWPNMPLPQQRAAMRLASRAAARIIRVLFSE
jgi:hypothetical protein